MTVWRCLVVSGAVSEWRSIEAPNRDSAISQLRSEGVTPLDLRSGQPSFSELLQRPIRLSRRLPPSEQALILRQLATLNRSGVPIDRSLDLLGEQSARTSTRHLLRDCLNRVRSGGSLAAALESAEAFPAYVSGVLRAAEKSGKLGDALTSLADRLELSASTRRQLITSLSYPAAILVATIAALFLVLGMVVPQFAPLFEGEEERLPELTQVVLKMSGLVTHHGVTTMAILIAIIIGLILAIRRGELQLRLAPSLQRLGLLSMRDQYLSAQFASLLGTLLSNGLRVVDALPLVRGALGSVRWQKFLIDAEREIRAGHKLSASLARGQLLPTTVTRLIEVGEQGGRIAEMSLQAGLIMGEAVRARIDRIVSLANPVAIILLGGLVGLLVAGVMLGIFALGDFAG